MNLIQLSLLLTLTASCGYESLSTVNAAWNDQERPEILNSSQGMDHNFNQLPLEGLSEDKPWSGDYWPSNKGGISYRWMRKSSSLKPARLYGYKFPSFSYLENRTISKLSPSEKFDVYMEDANFTISKYERERTKILNIVPNSPSFDPSLTIPKWEGLCHAWAPASLKYKSPKPVTLNSISGKFRINFGASDVKALLNYFVHHYGEKTYFLGTRCSIRFEEIQLKFRNSEINQEELRAEMESADCIGVNPGAFHLVLANEIGNKQESFIADLTRDFEVWNYPVVGYKSKVVGTYYLPLFKDAAPGTVKTLRLHTSMKYIDISGHSYNREQKPIEKTREYQYYLELNEKDEIIGGKWISRYRPDFLWRQDIPEFQGLLKELKTIYEASIADTQI